MQKKFFFKHTKKLFFILLKKIRDPTFGRIRSHQRNNLKWIEFLLALLYAVHRENFYIFFIFNIALLFTLLVAHWNAIERALCCALVGNWFLLFLFHFFSCLFFLWSFWEWETILFIWSLLWFVWIVLGENESENCKFKLFSYSKMQFWGFELQFLSWNIHFLN